MQEAPTVHLAARRCDGSLHIETVSGGVRFEIRKACEQERWRLKVCYAGPDGAEVHVGLLWTEDRDGLVALKRALEEESYAVDVCADGAEGLERGRSGSYDLILLDVMLPGMDGLAILDFCRKFRPEVPVILLTAFGTVDSAVAFISTISACRNKSCASVGTPFRFRPTDLKPVAMVA